jgi:hypothetical protein
MEYILVIIVFVAVLTFVALPIFTPADKETEKFTALNTLVAQRESAYQMIRDLDFDFQLGKIAETEYQTLRERYKTHAATVLHQIDALGLKHAVPSAATLDAAGFCTNCGTPREADDKFCRKCGNKLK